MTRLADLLSTVFERRYRPSPPLALQDLSLAELAEDLIGSAGETSGIALAGEFLCRFDRLDDDEKLTIFRHIATAMDIDASAARAALDAYQHAPSKVTYRAYVEKAEPRRQELIRRLNRVPGATGQLVRMRAELLRLGGKEPALAALDLDFRHLFVSWFNRGFLVLRPISWESPAHVLEKIIAYEAVHAIDSWDDLRRRLEPGDRRCFAFFHPAMPDEPLIFVEVALTLGIAGSIQKLLAETRQIIDAEDADTAVFYSISNCQAGLAGISFGNSLIKQVAADLSRELPGLKTFVTLSPMPGFARWLQERELSDDILEPEVLRALAALYLLAAKRADGLPLDPVARFHLGNGAMVREVHTGADVSQKGLNQSVGVMVNYLYDLAKVAQNHERFATHHDIAASSGIRALAATAQKNLSQDKPI
ncbi:malonyl-CoA decarboxylase [Roseovarius sp. E0-M6]|uniref:malonyl-CoA decarboxylase n=1 Tax=Roseovarius sp. E0-M6 TaxID=3127118 RepID=UPI00301038AE